MRIHITGNAQVVAEKIIRKGKRAPGAWRRASREMGDLWLREAQRLSATQFASTQQLRKMGHPYSRRGFRAKGAAARGGLPAPAYFINLQSGEVYRGWQLGLQEGYDSMYVRLTNTSRHFIYLHFGTNKMIARPILNVTLKNATKEFPRIYERAARRVHGYEA